MALLLRKTIDEQSFYAIWQITETTADLRSSITLRKEEENLYQAFVAENRKKQWLAYRILLKTLLAPEDISIEYDPAGKPYLAGSRMHISVTHTEDLAAVIISRNARVGIDIEKVRTRIEKVKDKFLSEEESSFLIKETELEQLTLAWCAKEALYKLYGLRNLDFRENIRVEIPATAGTDFGAFIRNGEQKQNYRLTSDKYGDFIIVYLVEQGLTG
jgi:4'-phosphopantetheinyl transferase